VYQRGRGREPMTVAGSSFPAVPFSIDVRSSIRDVV
jgi:hypothetical protein